MKGFPHTLPPRLEDPLNRIRDKCEQYWVEPHINIDEMHAILERIHRWAGEAQKERKR